MVAVVSGSGLGLVRSSAGSIGTDGQLGSAALGRAAQGVSVNAATGNLVIQTQDEFLVGLGPDAAFASSYNSLGAANGSFTNLDGTADADGWLLNTQRKIKLTGTGNTAGSTATLTDWDGSQVVFTYNTTTLRYATSEQPYNDDVLTWSGNVFTYTEGKSRSVQTFASSIGGRLIDMKDADGNTVTFAYSATTTAGKLTRVTTANSTGTQNGWVDYVYTANSLKLTTNYYDPASATSKTLSRVVYGYDSANRLSSVTTDLTPLNGADAVTYSINYTYKNTTSKLVTGITQSDGTSFTIAYDASNRVITLTQAMASSVTQTTSFAYDTVGLVTTITDALSNIYKMSYDGNGWLVKLEEPAPQSGGNPTIKTYLYDTNGNVTQALTFDNAANVGNSALAIEVTRSRFSSAGNLLERVFGNGSAVAYTYGALNEVLTETHYTGLDANGLADGAAPAGAMVAHFVYDEAGNGVSDSGAASGDDAAEKHLRYAISAEGRVTEYRYDGYGQLTSTISYTGNAFSGTTWTEAALATWVGTADKAQAQRSDYTYDFRGNLTNVTNWSATDSAGNGTNLYDWSRMTYVYDQAGRLLSRVSSGTNSVGYEAPPVTETFVYDGLGRVVSSTDLFGQTTTVTINDGTRTTTITTPNDPTQTMVFNVGGTLLSQAVSAAGVSTDATTYAYDALGRLRSRTDASGVSGYFVYDRQNRLTATIDADGSITEYKYDGADRLIATVSYAVAVSAASLTTLGNAATNTEVAAIRPAVSASDRWGWTIYNKAGQVIETIDAAGAAVKFDYDGAGRLIGSTAFSNVIAAATVNGADGISGYRTAQPVTLVLPTTDANLDRVARNFYDNDGLLIGSLDAEGFLTEVAYDKAGRKIEMIGYSGVTSSAQWASGSFAQLKASLTLSAANDIHNYRINDGRGRLMAALDGEGNVTRYHYTARGDLDQMVRGQQVTPGTSYTLASLPAASGTLETTVYNRNAAGQIASQVKTLSGGTETTSFTYDARGRLLSQSTSESVSSENRTQTMRYDAKGRLTGQLSGVGSAALAALGGSPSQAAVDNVYATYGTQYVYDIANRLIQKITPDGTGAAGTKSIYYYDADGQLRFEINAAGEVSELRYNVLENRTDTIVYGTRIAAGTLTTLSGGLVTSAITSAVAAIANSSLDSRAQAVYDNLGRGTFAYNPNYIANPTLDNIAQQTYYTLGEGFTAYSPAGSNGSSGPSGPTGSGTAVTGFSYRNYSRRGLQTSAYAYLYSAQGSYLGNEGSQTDFNAFGRATAVRPNIYDGVSSLIGYDRDSRIRTTTDRLGNVSTLGYDARGNLISSTDRTGKTAIFAYDLMGRNVTITTAEGIASSVKVNAFGQTILITDGAGRTRTYIYDKDGQLKTVTDAAGATTSNYDNAGRVIDVIDAKGVDTHYTYDAVGRVLTEVRDFGSGKLNLATTYAYDAKGEVISVTDAAGVVTTYQYDLKGQKTRVVQDTGSGKLNLTTDFIYGSNGLVSSRIDAAGTALARTTVFEFDSLGRLTKQVDDAGSGKLNQTTLFAYDAGGNVIARTDALSRVTRFVYDLENRLVLSIDAEGQATFITNDAEGRAIASRQFTTALSAAQLAAMADPAALNQWSSASVDASGNLTITKNVQGSAAVVAATISATAVDRINRTFYDGDGRAVYAVDGEGYVTQNIYDRANNVIQTIRYAAQTSLTSTSTTASVAALFTTTLNAGALATNIPADAAVTVYAYDGANRLTDVTDAEVAVTHFVLDALGQITDTHVAYGTGDVVVTHRVFDNVGRVTGETRAYGQSEAATTSFVYDAHGMATSVTDARGFITTMTYDALGRVLSQTVPLDATTSAVTNFQYDARGNRVKVTDPRGNSSYFYYDNLDRQVLQVDPEGFIVKTEYAIGSVISKVTRYAAAASNLTSVSATVLPTYAVNAAVDAVTQFTYDKLDRVKTSVDALGKSESYIYDALGNRIQVTNKLGGIIQYSFDKLGRARYEYTYFAKVYRSDGSLQADGWQSGIFEYDARGNLKHAVRGYGLTERQDTYYDYDKLDRLIKQTDPAFANPDAPTATLTPITQWAYDKRGDVVQQTAPDGGKTFSYFDHLGRKTSEVSPVGTLSQWGYDANGNLINQKIWSGTVALPGAPGGAPPAATGTARETQLGYDRSNRLTQSVVVGVRTGSFNGTSYVTSAAQNLTSINQYDAGGNLIKEIDANGGAIYHFFDRDGREVAKLDQEQFLTTWTRDADGNVLLETRYATKYTGTPVAGGTVPSVTTSADDRITSFTYDQMGRRLSEARSAVMVTTVTGGTISTASQTSAIAYTYNELGEVKSKLEASGDKTEYQYDLQGRLERQLDSVQADFNTSGAASVRHVTYFKYDGANNLVQATERAEVGTAALGAPGTSGSYAAGYATADDRVTSYSYNGGKLTGMTDAMLFTRSYTYDLAGRRTSEYYTRTKSDASTVTEGNFTAYDLAGRATAQWQASGTPGTATSTWTITWPQTLLSYNAFGEVTSRAVKASAADPSPLVQEQMVYDNAGRVVKTSADDGSWKVLVYDANGNATLTLTAITRDMSADTTDSALTAFGAIDTSADLTMAASISVYDKRNMVAATREPMRQIDATATRYTLARGRSYTAFGEVSSDTDARGNTTNYAYSTMGRMRRSEAPTVSITNEDGSSQFVRPSSDNYYDASGRLVATRDANGTYAVGGTSIAGSSKDANTGNLTTRVLLAGTGYGGTDAKVTKEIRADASLWESRYDAFGNERVTLDGLQRATTTSFDKTGHVTQVIRPSGFTDSYSYDQLGQRTGHTNSFYTGPVETTDYDGQGRVIKTKTFAGDVTNIAYLLHTSTNTGMGLAGGWTKTTTDAAAHTSSETSDHFGHALSRLDMQGLTTSFSYNRSGQLTSQSAPAGHTVTFTYFNTGQIAQSVDDAGAGMNAITATFVYDTAGNRTGEKQAGTVWSFDISYSTSSTQVLQDGTTTYDAMGRVNTFTNKRADGVVDVYVGNVYDAQGNVRRTTSTYPNIAYPQYGSITSVKWFQYDALSRMVVADGAQTGTTVTDGSMTTYNAAGERATATKGNAGLTGQVWTWVWYPDHGPGSGAPLEVPTDGINGDYQYVNASYTGQRRESYTYNIDGQLTGMYTATTGYTDNGDGTLTANNVFGAAELRAETTRDAMGRISGYREFLEGSNGVSVSQDRYSIGYDAYDRVTGDTVSQLRSGSTYLAQTTNTYAAAGGALTFSSVKNWLNGNDGNAADTSTSYTLTWADGSRVASSTYDSDTGSSSNPLFNSTYTYDGLGRMAKVTISDGRPRTVSFADTLGGQVLLRKERSSASANPEDRHYFVSGVQIAELTNNGNNDPERIDWNQSVLTHTWSPNSTAAPFRWNTTGGVTAAQMGADGYDPLSATGQGMSGTDSRYTVRAGDSLQSIAQSVWGDSSLWYVIASANGLSGASALVAGQSLSVPDKVISNTNNAGTYRPYDASHATGDLSPTTAQPPKKNKCGAFGMILIAIVAIAVATIVTAGAASLISGQAFGAVLGAMTGGAAVSGVGIGAWVAGGAIGGAIGSIASQGVGIALGVQDKINWKGVALAGIGGAVGGAFQGLNNAAKLAIGGAQKALKAGEVLTEQAAQTAVKASLGSVGGFLASSGLANTVVRSVISSTLTQGVGKLTGLQDKFNWVGVAGAAVGSMASYGLGGAMGASAIGTNASVANISANLAASMAGNIANAATRSVIDGTDFGDNVIASLPDTIAQTIMDLAFRAVSKPHKENHNGNQNEALGPSPEQVAEDAQEARDSLLNSDQLRKLEPQLAQNGVTIDRSGKHPLPVVAKGTKPFVTSDKSSGYIFSLEQLEPGPDGTMMLRTGDHSMDGSTKLEGITGTIYVKYDAPIDIPLFAISMGPAKGYAEHRIFANALGAVDYQGGFLAMPEFGLQVMFGAKPSFFDNSSQASMFMNADWSTFANSILYQQGGSSDGGFFRSNSPDEVARVSNGPSYREDSANFMAWDSPTFGQFTIRSRVLFNRLSDPIANFYQSNLGNGSGFQRNILTPSSYGLNYVYQGSLGPNSIFGKYITKPVDDAFYGTVGLIADSPLGDPGVIATMESNGVSAPAGALMGGLKSLNNLAKLRFPSGIAAEATVAQVSKNSLSYVGDTHVYVIKGADGSIWKYGESAQGLSSSELSLRGEKQARALRQQTGEFYRSEIIETFPAKAPARSYETYLIRDYVAKYGQRPPGNKVDR